MGRMLGSTDSRYCAVTMDEPYTSGIVSTKLFIATNPITITAISGVTTTAGTGGACTVTFVKCANGVALANGIALNSGSFNLVGTVDTIQNLTLINTPGNLDMNVNDSVAMVLTGTATSAVGTVQITYEPR